MGATDSIKNLIQGFGSVGLGMLAAYGLLGLVGGQVLFGLVAILLGVAGIVIINGIVETPLDMS